MHASAHFDARTQQRGISPAMVEMIFELGKTSPRGDLVLLNRKAVRKAVANLNRLKHDLEKMHKGGGIAYDGETLITAFHLTKKFKHA